MTTILNNNPLSIYYPLPKMNPKNISNVVPIYSSSSSSTSDHNSVCFFLKDFQERFIPSFSSKKYLFHSIKKKASNHQEIEKEWAKINPLLIQLHLFYTPLTFPNVNLNDSSWNFMHYFPLTNTQTNNSNNNTHNNIKPNYKYYLPSIGLFLMPHSFYLSNLQSSDLILSLYDVSDEQIVYLSLFALLVQNHKGSFVLKLNYFYTPLIMDVLYLLSCVYNKVIILPIDYIHFYVVCKGFQMEYLKPYYEQIKHIMHILRPNSLQRIMNKESVSSSSLRIFSTPLPSLFTSKIEEINVLVHHKQLMLLND